MFDQSFSAKNFRKIYDTDRKNKGTIEVEHFHDAYIIRLKINRLKKTAKFLANRYKNDRISSSLYEDRKDTLNKHIEYRKEQYNNLVNNKLKEISNTVSVKGYSLPLSKSSYQIRNKDVFSTGNDVETIFVTKQIQNTLKSIFNIKISNRDIIISRLSALAKDMSPKYMIRADVEHFYESIKHKNLLYILHSSTKLSVGPRRIITQLIREYKKLTGDDTGLPRGVGISACLSEIYMSSIDYRINLLQDVIYYERYVDDLIVIFSPTKKENTDKYLDQITKIINERDLSLNKKTKEIDLYNQENKEFEYLGYKFQLSSSLCKISLSHNKMDKIRKRVKKSFSEYDKSYKQTPRRAHKLLLQRLRFLTGNTRLYNSKSKAFIGVYFSNRFITNTSDLYGLDCYLAKLLNNIQDQKLKKRISKLSFKKGFENKIFRKFSMEELSNISKGWKNG